MTQLLAYRCDRCKKRFYLSHNQTPLHIEHRDFTSGLFVHDKPLHETDHYDLCEDCNSSFLWLMDYPNSGKRIDAFIEQLSQEADNE